MNIDDCHITVIPTGSAHELGMRPFLLDCLSIREQVFCEEQQVAFDVEQDGKDHESGHILLWMKNVPVGTLRFRRTDEGLRLERVAVLKPYRGLSYGKLLIRAGVRAARQENPEGPIYLHAQTFALGFYEKMGFIPVGDEFNEGGLPHRSMLLPGEEERSILAEACGKDVAEQAG